MVHNLELANGGVLSVAKFPCVTGDWNFVLEECVVLAMDLGQHARIAHGGVRRTNLTFSMRMMLDHLFREKRPYMGEANCIEYLCDVSVLSIFYRSKSPSDLGKKLGG